MFKKVRLVKSGRFSFSPSQKIKIFCEGTVVELIDKQAQLLVDVGWACFVEHAIDNQNKLKEVEAEDEADLFKSNIVSKKVTKKCGRKRKVRDD